MDDTKRASQIDSAMENLLRARERRAQVVVLQREADALERSFVDPAWNELERLIKEAWDAGVRETATSGKIGISLFLERGRVVMALSSGDGREATEWGDRIYAAEREVVRRARLIGDRSAADDAR